MTCEDEVDEDLVLSPMVDTDSDEEESPGPQVTVQSRDAEKSVYADLDAKCDKATHPFSSQLERLTHGDPLTDPEQVLSAVDSPDYCIERCHFADLTVAALRRRIMTSRCPLIITGMGSHMAPGSQALGLELLSELLGLDCVVPVRGQGDIKWIEFLERLCHCEQLYLADISVARHYPWLFQHVRIPRYFLHCFSHRTRHQLSMAYDTPALFVGTPGTRSSLHIDQMCSNFWMFLSEGRKHWITFHPDDTKLLSPTLDQEDQIYRFRSLSELEADPEASSSLRKARKIEFTISAGDLLFIPHGTPHEVTNLTATCAISANFFDQSNIKESLEQTARRLAEREPGSERHSNLALILNALEEIDWPDLEEDLSPEDDLPRSGDEMAGCFPCHEPLKWRKAVTFRTP
ncbi:unnamed protein product [Polarella glacialis]|uniref:JmjC domain-containing protein n=1 Tax=Polarella glacialis TaxID=89957 RepID=A0A813GRT2_POLGL|nr:unnamed protein product [Polarella glacialis]